MAEITLNDEFGQNIAKFCEELNLQNCLEIGSWDGQGSTQCFIEGMKHNDPIQLMCIEVNPQRYQDLVNATKQYDWVYPINGTSISYDDLLCKDFDRDVWNSPYNKIKADKEVVRSWYNADLNSMHSKTGIIRKNWIFDGVLIDGSEFTGYSEYTLLKDSVNVFFLDDYYNAFKTRQVAWELNNNPDWEVVAGNRYLRNGYAIFKRKKFL